LDEGVKRVPIDTISDYCDRLLQVREIEDWSGAVNGLQVQNRNGVAHVAAAVDASLATVKKAVALGADLLLVHHGLFWAPKHPWTGNTYDLIEILVEAGLGVYSAHLPLDVHPRYGNNALLTKALGGRQAKPFFFDRGRHLGLRVTMNLSRSDLIRRVASVLGGDPVLLPGGPKRCRSIGIVTGGAGAELRIAAREGVDTFITGEGPHWTYALAEEEGINVIYGGHYATETFGVRRLAEHLAKKFRIQSSFIDHPTGL
tara:strand:+ start:871 stop:1644 length:774 start_codon:yes stop_codon:yes gene_type:complete